jgi:hypothetical protein
MNSRSIAPLPVTVQEAVERVMGGAAWKVALRGVATARVQHRSGAPARPSHRGNAHGRDEASREESTAGAPGHVSSVGDSNRTAMFRERAMIEVSEGFAEGRSSASGCAGASGFTGCA